MSFVIIIFIIGLLVIGLPLYSGIFLIASYLYLTDNIPLISSISSFTKLQSQEFIAAISLFTFSGYVLSKSSCPKRIINLFSQVFSFSRVLQFIVLTIILIIFTSLTGASGVAILALGGLIYPILQKLSKENQSFSIGLITSSSSVGLLVAPSLPVIIYAMVAQQNSNDEVNVNLLFQATLIPTALLIFAMIVYSYFTNCKNSFIAEKFDFRKTLFAVNDTKYEIFLPVLIYGGIYSGTFTILESAIITTNYIFIVYFFVRRDLSIKKDFVEIAIQGLKLAGNIFIIMSTAAILIDYFIDQKIADKIFYFVSPYINNKYVFLIFLNIFLLLAGVLLDIFSAILITLPLLIPITEKFGINPYHFAVIFLINLEIGYLTPPVGMNLFIASYRFKQKIATIYRSTFPFLLLMLGILVLVTYLPALSLATLENKKVVNSNSQTKIITIKNVQLKVVEDKISVNLQANLQKGKKYFVAMKWLDEKTQDVSFFEDLAEETTITNFDRDKNQINFIAQDLDVTLEYTLRFKIYSQNEKGNYSSLIFYPKKK